MMNRDRKNIINFETQGWPLYQQSIRDIISSVCEYDEDTNRFYINGDDKKLDLVPRVLEDDGMGYGVNEKRIVEFRIFGDTEQYCNIFVEESIENIELWLEGKFYPHCFVKQGRKRYIVRGIRKDKDGIFEYECESYTSKKGPSGEYVWITENKLKYD